MKCKVLQWFNTPPSVPLALVRCPGSGLLFWPYSRIPDFIVKERLRRPLHAAFAAWQRWGDFAHVRLRSKSYQLPPELFCVDIKRLKWLRGLVIVISCCGSDCYDSCAHARFHENWLCSAISGVPRCRGIR